MTKIILLNTAADVPVDFLPRVPSCLATWRQIWWAEPNDIIVSPVPIESSFVAYAERVLRCDLSGVQIVVAPDACVDDAALVDFELLRTLSDAIEQLPSKEGAGLVAATLTPGVIQLAETLGLAISSPAFGAEGPNELLNRKSFFRRIAAGVGSPLPPGTTVTRRRDLPSALEKYSRATGTVIVKRENAGGGYGNVILTEARVGSLPGARTTIRANKPVDFHKWSPWLWNTLADATDSALVVEEYHEARDIFYLEFTIENDASVAFVNSGDLRLSPDSSLHARTWLGLQVPTSAPSQSTLRALTSATLLAKRASDLGYRGFMNVDCIITPQGQLFSNEFNCRWGGGTVVHILGERLLGANFGDHHLIRWVRGLPFQPIYEAVNRLQAAGLDPLAQREEGVVVMGVDGPSGSTIELAVRSRSSSEADSLEDRAREALAPGRRDAGQCPAQPDS